MKKVLLIVLAVVVVAGVIFGLAASSKFNNENPTPGDTQQSGEVHPNDTTPTETYTMKATVIEVNTYSLLVEPFPGSNELNTADKFVVSLENRDRTWPSVGVGTCIEVTYDGKFLETYPIQLGEIYKLDLTSPDDAPPQENATMPHNHENMPTGPIITDPNE